MAKARVGIIDYGMGNLKSVWNALDYVGEDAVISAISSELDACSHLILPGVGAFPQAMKNIMERGLNGVIGRHVRQDKPLLGICLGMQLFADEGEEVELCKGLGLVPGCVRKLDVPLHIPHVGWNTLQIDRRHPVLEGLNAGVDFYFVHSYHFEPASPGHVLATCEYGKRFVCAVTNGRSAVAVQFHPEKSQDSGLRILENFCAWDGHGAC